MKLSNRMGRRKELVFIGICLITIALLFISMRERVPRKDFVHMQNGSFVLNDGPFHPMVMNYSGMHQTNGFDIWPAPYKGYTPAHERTIFDRDSCRLLIDADMKLIKKMGFNTLRIVKVAEGLKQDKTTGGIFLNASLSQHKDTLLDMADAGLYEKYIASIGALLDLAHANDLKVILLTNVYPDEKELKEHWTRLADRFQDRSVILAFDLFNEPLYFDSLPREKEEVYRIVKDWRGMMRQHAPDHLFTIGLQGVREVFEWDPNILDVDFISFHPYEYEPEQVRNELRWYHDQIDVPWIIGETSLPADNDSVPYADQVEFTRKVLRQCHDCDGQGFSWWQYKDVQWGDFHSDYMGMVSLKGTTQVENSSISISGTPKPTVNAIREFDPGAGRGDCLLLPNYANYSSHSTAMITGRLTNEKGAPIAGGVVIGWNEWWSRSFHTITDHDGYFQLRGNFYFHHWMATATRHSWVRGDVMPSSYITLGHGIPERYIGVLQVEELPLRRLGSISL